MIRYSVDERLSLDAFIGEEDKGRYNYTNYNLSTLTQRIKRGNESKDQEYEEALTVRSMEYCSRFETCSAPKCPLDIFIGLRSSVEDDPKCEMAKATRHKYWQSMDPEIRSLLPFQGYLETEFKRMRAARERWDALPEERKAEVRTRLKRLGGAVDE